MGQRDSMSDNSTAENTQEKPAGLDQILVVEDEVMQGQEIGFEHKHISFIVHRVLRVRMGTFETNDSHKIPHRK